MKSKEATSIAYSHIQSKFWKFIDNNNQVTKRRIGKLKGLIKNKIKNKPLLIGKHLTLLRLFLTAILRQITSSFTKLSWPGGSEDLSDKTSYHLSTTYTLRQHSQTKGHNPNVRRQSFMNG